MTAFWPQDRTSRSPVALEILANVKISEVYQALGGPKLRGMRGPAFWRDGDGYNVGFDDSKGAWFDFTVGAGGGILEMITLVRGGNRADALRWVADLAGIRLDDKPFSAADRARWAQERREFERELHEAWYWQRAAVSMAEDLLDMLKAALVETALPQTQIGDIAHIETLLQRLRWADGGALLAEYHWWVERYPGMAAGMVRAAKAREQTERRALVAYLHNSEPKRRAA